VTYWLGFNGERMAGSKDWVTLRVHEPDVSRWVLDEMVAWVLFA
jgi:hypothetical protein